MEPYFCRGTEGLNNFLGRVIGGVETSRVFVKDDGAGFGDSIFRGDVFFHADNSIPGEPLTGMDLLFEFFTVVGSYFGYAVDK